MAGTPASPGNSSDTPVPQNEPKLESWGEIAAYLRRDIRTVQRWEREAGLPIRRLIIGKLGQVYAYRSELDRWVLQRQPKAEPGPDRTSSDPSLSPPKVPPDQPQAADVPPPSPSPSPSPFPLWKSVLAISLLAAFGLSLFFALRWKPHRDTQARVLLFVRPFTSAAGERDFVQGLTHELITQLGGVSPRSLGVFAPTTSQELGAKSINELRQQLHADFVLEGNALRDKDLLRIDVDLVSTTDQTPAWAHSYTGNLHNVLAFQDEVANDVARHLLSTLHPPAPESAADKDGTVISLGSGEMRLRPSVKEPVNPQVYEAYLEGRVYLLDRDFPRSMTAFQRALQTDPKYGPALAGLSMSVLLLGETPNDAFPPAQAMPKARQYAYQALGQDPNLSDAYCVLANIAQGYDHDLREAERLYNKAIELDPRNVTALKWYSDYLFVVNRLQDASKQIDKALELDPASPLLNTAKAEVKYYERDFDTALAQAQHTIDQHPEFILARFWLASAYRQKKMYPQAIEQFDELRRRYPSSPAMLMAYGHALGLSGDRAGAQRILKELLTQSHSRYVPSAYIAGMYTSLGDLDQAFRWLDQAYAEKSDRLVYLGVDPIADPLRPDPRFATLMKKVGLP